VTTETNSTDQTLTAAERQEVLRRLKHGPALPKSELAEYATRLRAEIIANRTRKEVNQ
jgi:translation initiation factor 2 beta subunit (eIF-2beta)/eIF-5